MLITEIPATTLSVRTRARRLTAAAAVTVFGVCLGACDAVYAPRFRVSRPPAAATPEQVTDAFFQALSVKDRATALSLVASGDSEEQAVAQSWMDNTWSLRAVTVQPGATDPGGADVFAGRYHHLAEVTLNFTPHWLPWVEPPGLGLEPGRLTWFVTLGRHDPGQRWAVLEEGSGP